MVSFAASRSAVRKRSLTSRRRKRLPCY